MPIIDGEATQVAPSGPLPPGSPRAWSLNARSPRIRHRVGVQRRLLGQAVRGVLGAVASHGLFLIVAGVLAPAVVRVGLPLLGRTAILVRRHSDRRRRWAGQVLGQPVGSPPLPAPGPDGRIPAGAVLRDRGVRRDVAWLGIDATAGLALSWLVPALWLGAAWSLTLVVLWAAVPPARDLRTLGFLDGTGPVGYLLEPVIGLAQLLVAVRVAEPLTRTRARLARSMLAPDPRAVLTRRVEHLARSRADSLELQASEIRRIERDLHDGAQARLVAMGLNLGLAQSLLRDDPDAAQALLDEARQNNRLALAELRDLVHGIHPPVLADRGLDGAVRALALDCPQPVALDLRLPGRVPAPVESAAYFAVAECLTNAVKHAAAQRVWVRIEHRDGRLGIVVSDDGVGGADPQGTGLHGISRRLAAFDAAMSVTSPPGGPTVVAMELPCTLF